MRTERQATAIKRKRRTSEEVVDRIIKAAGEEFELNGYAGATTAAIARRAGVAETLIFSNFGTKASLFQRSIFTPLNEQLVAFSAGHLTDSRLSHERFDAERREFISELQLLLKANARKLASLVVAQLYGDVQGVGEVDGLREYLAQATAHAEGNIREPAVVPAALMTRISFATILSCVVFKDWLFPDGIAADGEIDAAVIAQVIGGLKINDPAQGAGARPGDQTAKL